MNRRVYDKRPTIGVIMPMLSGFYMGELNATFRQMAKEHGVNLIFIRSGDRREFDLPVALHHLDALVIVLHSAADHLVQKALSNGIPVLSLGASYSPLEVEQFTSVQSDGVAALYRWLLDLGHTRIGFCGDLSVNDVRSRFKAFQHAVNEHSVTFNPDDFFCVSNCSLAGGREAAVELVQRNSQCTAVICATDHNAIGMIEQLKHLQVSVPGQVAVVGIDNVFFGQQTQPPLTSADQQLEVLARQAFARALERIEGATFSGRINQVPQKIVIRQSCGNRNPTYESTECPDSIRHALLDAEGRSPIEIFENFYSQAQNGFNSILDAQSLYGNNLDWACLATCNQERYHVESWVEQGMTQPTTVIERTGGDIRDFPTLDICDHFVATVMPVTTGQKSQWKLVALVDSQSNLQSIGTQSVFNNYLDMLSLFIERDALLNTSNQRQKNSQQLLQQLKVVSNSSNDGIWDWDLLNNQLRWNSRLVNMLGSQNLSDEQSIDCDQLFQFIHPEDIERLENNIHAHLIDDIPFKTEFRIRRYDDRYIWVQANGSAVRNAKGKAVRFIGSMTDVTEQRESAAKIHHMAYFDSLTGVANRRKVMEDIVEHIRTNPGRPRAIMLMDLNRFKMINDSFGHHVGDALLCHITRELESVLSEPHTIARLGGDEFLFFCDISNVEQANQIASIILRTIEKPMIHDEIELVGQGSLGISFYPFDGTSPEELVKKADIAMYQAKQDGGRKVVLYNNTMEVETQSLMKFEHHLNRAIEQQEIEVFYQPLICNRTQQVIGVEALARWHSDELGYVPADQFIQVAEGSGMITQLGEHIFNRVCRDVQQSSWLRSMSHISVNISAKQLVRRCFADEVIQTILNHRLPLSMFCMEITETALITDYHLCVQSLNKLRVAGITISLDDFGTGYSSLSLLKKLPLSEVKIDRSFIADIIKDQSSLDFVSTMIQMIRSLGYRVVAEGVETSEHAHCLDELGVDLLQGYYFSKPQPVAWLEQHYQPEKCSDECMEMPS
ncbi:EAL domain-containing protein [Vibrio sp. B1FLJ16]|uniref:EAL domain-containing protein n=1 Tax=Vibrio sp. B1FLJ16 TaxID=2751178 RepID=UPI0015F451F7|nr:EAL domain-containing protein [Vibrio sp. B1FLJ16]CAD7817767.1 Diguanylate cyclase phosphodiesterase with PAS PAC sensor(S) [Vibrio sp. B1FLJ16]CAE6932205.1 Diguanylate cyclase phosphodiesterase with PAS PAC sensor(S) [Vibrio sp. B1FLJ16]